MTDPYRVLQVTPEAEPEVVTAAYYALAKKYHPDRDASTYAARRIREVNAAYALLRDPAFRSRLQRDKRVAEYAAAAASPPSMRAKPNGQEVTRLTFGRYAGSTLADIARRDPDYLRWLSRHSSGLAFRTEINTILDRVGVAAS
jgi:curved DNA-binding protein CbpA